MIAATLTMARLAWLRLWRGKLLWVTAILVVLPLLAAALAAARVHQPEQRWNDIAELIMRSLVLIAPVIHLSQVIGEELDAKTYTYLWSRPMPRSALVLGKMLAVTPPLAVVAAMTLGAAWFIVGAPEDANIGVACAAAAIGVLAASCFAVGVGALFPRYPLVTALGWVFTAEQALPEVPAANNASTLYHVEVMAGLKPGSVSGAFLSLLVLSALWLALALWRVGVVEARNE